MQRQIIQQITDAYGLQVRTVAPVQKGYRNESYRLTLADGSVCNLICFKREADIVARIRRADSVAQSAYDAGLPVRTRADPRLLHVGGGTYAALYTYLPGATISWEAYTTRHIKLLGWAIGDLHAALRDVQDEPRHRLTDELHAQLCRMQHYFARDDVQTAMCQKLSVTPRASVFDSFARLLDTTATRDGQQYLHMDMVRGNALFGTAQPSDRWQIDGVALTGLIDFEKTAYGLPVCDAARTLAFLLVDCRKPPVNTLRYFLHSGYRKRGNSELAHTELLSPFVLYFLVHDFYKFLRHTPYESLADNLHYRRTRDLLLGYDMIEANK